MRSILRVRPPSVTIVSPSSFFFPLQQQRCCCKLTSCSSIAFSTATSPSSSTTTSSSLSSSSSTTCTTTTTNFGYQRIPLHEKEGKVRHVFDSVADHYDVMNDLMSAGLHRLWKDYLLTHSHVQEMASVCRRSRNRAARNDHGADSGSGSERESDIIGQSLAILDVAGGTGDLSFRFIDAADCLERSKSSGDDPITVTLCDINAEMLRVAEERARTRYGHDLIDQSKALRFSLSNAQELPFDAHQFDLYTIAFGLRNVTDIDVTLREAVRVLKPGGRFMCLEFSPHVPNEYVQAVYDEYSVHAIPRMGELVTGDRSSYQYLVESIRKFCNQEALLDKMRTAGMVETRYTNLTQGIVALHEGWKDIS